MGTHGRNAVTRNGVHTCCEQTLDGHYAMEDLTDPFLIDFNGAIPKLDPSMDDETDECEQEGFAHIDYDNKILYTSQCNPNYFLDESITSKERQVRETISMFAFDTEKIKDYFEIEDTNELIPIIERFSLILMNERKLRELGWTVRYEVWSCPTTTRCVNSTQECK